MVFFYTRINQVKISCAVYSSYFPKKIISLHNLYFNVLNFVK